MKTALTIAGSDCSGGAGIQADLKTMTAHGVYGMSAVTALTAQNTTGVTGIMEVTIAQKLKVYHAQNIVLDPGMVATSGARLISEDAVSALTEQLMPLACVVTPNIPEAEVLTEIKICTPADMEHAARQIAEQYGSAVLLKGGHSLSDANDYLYDGETGTWMRGERIDNPNTHGTGCTLSSAIASNLAKGYGLADAVRRAKQYLSGALADQLDLGAGSGPMNHAFDLHSEFAES